MPRTHVVSSCVCTRCSTNFPVPRNRGYLRKKGHTKTFYCHVCKTITDHEERHGDA